MNGIRLCSPANLSRHGSRSFKTILIATLFYYVVVGSRLGIGGNTCVAPACHGDPQISPRLTRNLLAEIGPVGGSPDDGFPVDGFSVDGKIEVPYYVGGEIKNASAKTKTKTSEGTSSQAEDVFHPFKMHWPRPLDEKKISERTQDLLYYQYLYEEKAHPYVGSDYWLKQFPVGSSRWLNSFAVFAGATPPTATETTGKGKGNGHIKKRMHGLLGRRKMPLVTTIASDLTGHFPSDKDTVSESLSDAQILSPRNTVYKQRPMPEPMSEVKKRGSSAVEEKMSDGGFYLELSDALPLDRDAPDTREDVCRDIVYDYQSLPEASVVITYYNEPVSTLLRTVHSVLNHTPPPLLREIILVDDHSNRTEILPGGFIDQYIRYLPKTKLMRLPERRGLVHARLAGARAAKGEVLVILDSHVEVNDGWLEPQLDRIRQNPTSFVFPQILSVSPEDFTFSATSGIGCEISFKWSMQEQSSLASKTEKPDPIASSSMAGGLFAVSLDFFWHIGGYDEGFEMWGAENVELGFRIWLCGGRLECTPCARTYHIYRQKGMGYSSPKLSLSVNRLRTAKVWTDEYFALARLFLESTKTSDLDVGNLDKMLVLKENLKCKPFKYFLTEVEKDHKITSIDDILLFGEVKSLAPHSVSRGYKYCLDTMSHNEAGETYSVFPCHGEGGTQNWLAVATKSGAKQKRGDQKMGEIILVPVTNERYCAGTDLRLHECDRAKPKFSHFQIKKVEPRAATASTQAIGPNTVLLLFAVTKKGVKPQCLGVERSSTTGIFASSDCTADNPAALWEFEPLPQSMKQTELPTISPAYRERQNLYRKQNFLPPTNGLPP